MDNKEKQIMEQEEVDYKALYLELFREVDRAVTQLIHAQLRCEELYISAGEQPDFATQSLEEFLLSTELQRTLQGLCKKEGEE